MVRYDPAIIERGAEGFGVLFPDVPGCISAGGQAVRERLRQDRDAA